MSEPTPEHARRTVDELEEKVLGHTHDQRRDDDESGRTDRAIDPAETTADEGGHTDAEPPV